MQASEYRLLKAGEIIQAGDEVDMCVDSWRDPAKWVPVSEKSIGRPASDPRYSAHVIYRRKLSSPGGA